MPNIQFNYLYRDSGNYKQFGSVIFTNPNNLELAAVEKLIRDKLIDGSWFYATEWGIPELFSENCDFRGEPTWHEFESVEYNDWLADGVASIEGLIKAVEAFKV